MTGHRRALSWAHGPAAVRWHLYTAECPRPRRRRAELARVTALEGAAAGLHALLPLESAEQERVLIGRGRRAGVGLHGLHTHGYWREPGGDRPAALILGYATPPPHAWSPALEALAALLRSSGTENLLLSGLVH